MARVVLITGAARRIGAEITRAFHAREFRVLIHYRHSADEAAALAAALNDERPDSAATLRADLDEPNQVRRLATDAVAHWQRLDVLVNNASTFYPTPLGEATDADWDRLLGSNLRAPWELTQALAPALQETSGAILNLADVYAERPLWEHGLYCMAKAGLVSLTRSSARELGPRVRVNAVAPGPILWPEQGPGLDAGGILEASALGRCGEPADIAGAVVWLALDAPFVTGQVLPVDGGRNLPLAGG